MEDRDWTPRRSEPSCVPLLNMNRSHTWDRLLAPGCDELTSRCQTSCRCELFGEISLLSLGTFYPFERDGLPHRTTGSLWLTCPVRLVCPTVSFSLCYYTQIWRFPSALNQPFCKPPLLLGDRPSQIYPPDIDPLIQDNLYVVCNSNIQGWYLKDGLTLLV